METLGKVIKVLVWAFFGLLTLGIVGGIFGIIALLQKGFDEDLTLDIETDRAVAVVDIEGEILSADEFYRSLKKRADNPDIKAIVVRIDSPGGAVGASEEMYTAIVNARKKKPVVCSLGTVAASGGLLASLGCEKIVTNSGTMTGSIGVIMSLPNVSRVLDKYDVGMTVVKSGALKDAGSPFRSVTADDQKYLQGVIDEAHDQFVKLIAESRQIPEEKVRSFADGRIILGETAVELGIADQVGNLDTAAALALELAKIEGEPEIILPPGDDDFFSMLEESVAVLTRGIRSRGPQLLYRLVF